MPTAVDLSAIIVARLKTLPGTTILDSEVTTSPAGAYAVFYDNAPEHWTNNLGGKANRSGYEFRVICVGKSPSQCRNTSRLVSGVLLNWRWTADRGASWVSEIPTGAPILPDRSVPNDIRYSQTLYYRTHF